MQASVIAKATYLRYTYRLIHDQAADFPYVVQRKFASESKWIKVDAFGDVNPALRFLGRQLAELAND